MELVGVGGEEMISSNGGGDAGIRGGVRSVDLSVGVYLTPPRYGFPVVSLHSSPRLRFFIFWGGVWACAWLVVFASLPRDCCTFLAEWNGM